MSDRSDLVFILLSRVLRSIATGALGVTTGLYLYNVLHLSATLIGVFFGVGAFTTPLMSLYFGRLGDCYGRKKILLIALLFLPAATAMLLLTSNYALLLIAAALGGFGTAGALASGSVGAVVAPMMTALLADKTNEENRTMVYSLLNLASGLAGAVGALLAHLSYREGFMIALGLSTASFIAILPVRDRYSEGVVRGKCSSVNSKLDEKDRKVIRRFIITGAFNGIGQGLVTPFLPIIFEILLKIPKGEIGNIFFLGGVAAALISLLTPIITSRLGFVKTVVLTRSISTAALITLPFVNHFSPVLSYDVAIAMIAYLIYVMFRVVSLPAQSALMMSLVSQGSRSTTAGANQAARLLPSAAATLSSGAMIDYVALPTPFIVTVIINGINIYLYTRFFKDVKTNRGVRSIVVE
ncbi:MFS transporter [Caldivirga sp. UBA161]|uniref:MFS transporter n=1 Tax=Caldivirga sp. UBA161 TaxID=1915569 RepID=UPI0025C3B9EA|nr:MFS transporter [Caldivirga sp. UBA161]